MAKRARQTGEIRVERQIDFCYCSNCRRYRSMIKLNNKWICSECGYQEKIKTMGVNNEPNR
jgi:ribosomal protein S27AE